MSGEIDVPLKICDAILTIEYEGIVGAISVPLRGVGFGLARMNRVSMCPQDIKH